MTLRADISASKGGLGPDPGGVAIDAALGLEPYWARWGAGARTDELAAADDDDQGPVETPGAKGGMVDKGSSERWLRRR